MPYKISVGELSLNFLPHKHYNIGLLTFFDVNGSLTLRWSTEYLLSSLNISLEETHILLFNSEH